MTMKFKNSRIHIVSHPIITLFISINFQNKKMSSDWLLWYIKKGLMALIISP